MIRFDRNSKALVLHHNDFDGAVSAIVAGNVFQTPVFYAPTEFYTIEEKLKVIDYNDFDVVFVLDCHPSDEAYLDLSEKIVLLDHHASSYHNPGKGRFVISDKNKSAAWVAKVFFEKYFKEQIDLSHLSKLVDLATDYDCWIRKNPRSTFIADMYKTLYEPYQFRTRFFNGDCRLTSDEVQFVRKRKDQFQTVYDNVVLHEFDDINGCLIDNDKFVNEISQRLADDGYKIIFTSITGKNRVSIRNYVSSVNIGKVLDDLGIGGGHPQAAGFFEDDRDELLNKIYNVIDVIKDNPEFRREDD